MLFKVMPRKLDGGFSSSFLQGLHDFFHFKKLYLEEIMKFIYVLANVATVCAGFFIMLSYNGYYRKESNFLMGVGILVGGPIALRFVYESLMMFILLVKNVMDINKKLPDKKQTSPCAAPVQQPANTAPAASAAPAAEGWTCVCGTTHPDYEYMCSCGVSKTDAKKMQQQ